MTLQEVQVLRSVETWLRARKREMEAKGEENISLHMKRITLSCMEHVRYDISIAPRPNYLNLLDFCSSISDSP